MISPEQKKRLLKAKIAVALQDELGRVPKETEINQVFMLTRVMYKAVLGLHFKRREQKKQGQLAIFRREAVHAMLIGYARVSKNEQNLDLQRDALLKAGCTEKNIYTDKITGLKQDRKGLEQALSHLREGDTFVVWRLDRLGRSLKHLIETITALQSQGIGFKSLTENIDTSTATGQLVFHIFGALAEFERNLIKERTIAGLDAARSRGRRGGRPNLKTSASKVTLAKKLYADRSNSVDEICKTLRISKATLYRYVKKRIEE